MSRILYTLIFILIILSTAAAQDTNPNSSKSDSLNETNFSDSVPYRQREYELTEADKKKQAKEAKKAAEQKPTQSLPTDLTVRIPVYVYNPQGKAVNDLQKSDFKVFIDDREQEIAAFETGRTARTFLLIVDTSPSLAYEKKDLKNVVTALLAALDPSDQIQIVTFSENLRSLNEMTSDPDVLKKAVKKIETGNGTSIYETVATISRKYLSQSPAPPTVIFLTDGIDTTSRTTDYFSSLSEAERTGAVVLPFYFDSFEYFQKNPATFPGYSNQPAPPNLRGVTQRESLLGRAYLQDLADLSGGRIFTIKNFNVIKKEDFDGVLNRIEPLYYLSVKQSVTSNAFQRKQIRVRVGRPNLAVKARGSLVTGEKKGGIMSSTVPTFF